MTTTLIDAVQPYIVTIVVALIGVLTTLILAGLKTLQKKAEAWLQARTNESEREILKKIGQEGFAHAEALHKELGGDQKLTQAIQYADKRIRELGLGFGLAEIKAAIHEAVVNHNAKTKWQVKIDQPTIEINNTPGKS